MSTVSTRVRWLAAGAAALVALVVAAVLWWWLARPAPTAVPAGGETEVEVAGEQLLLPVDLYFPGRYGRLYAERRELEVTEDPGQQLRVLVEALLAGPQNADLSAVLPPEITLAAAYLGEGGIAYIDLRSPDGAEPPASGSTLEMQRVYSLVNSVALNLAEVRRVVVLWNGAQRLSFAGHLDTSRALAPNTDLVAR